MPFPSLCPPKKGLLFYTEVLKSKFYASCHAIKSKRSNAFAEKLNLVMRGYYQDSSFSVVKLGKLLFLCNMQLHRKVLHHMGVSPGRYILLYRLNEAVKLLLATDNAIGDIAFQTGFGNQNNFTRAFKRELSVTPIHFRRYAGENVMHGLNDVIF